MKDFVSILHLSDYQYDHLCLWSIVNDDDEHSTLYMVHLTEEIAHQKTDKLIAWLIEHLWWSTKVMDYLPWEP